MGLGHIIHKAKKTGLGAYNGAKNGLLQGNKEVACIKAINDVRNDVQGHDPRKWMISCAKETLFKLGGPDDFKKCLLGKVKKEIKDISDPEAYVESLWDQIKGSCNCWG